jgi:HNH endonuclease
MARTAIPLDVRVQVLTEAGYRCAVPTCRNILALDLHHIVEVKDRGPNDASNLLALCPTCHALYTRGTISREAINTWKLMLVTLNHAFDQESISNLLFLYHTQKEIDARTLKIMEDQERKQSIRMDGSELQELDAKTITDINLLMVSGDGVLKFSHLIASGLVTYQVAKLYPAILYYVRLTYKGWKVVEAWLSGNRSAVKEALGALPQE